MAATIATAYGTDKSRIKETHRLGSENATGQAATWRTFAVASVNRDGSGYISVHQNGELLARVTFGPEDAPPAVDIRMAGRSGVAYYSLMREAID
jgi:hypothetical protein